MNPKVGGHILIQRRTWTPRIRLYVKTAPRRSAFENEAGSRIDGDTHLKARLNPKINASSTQNGTESKIEASFLIRKRSWIKNYSEKRSWSTIDVVPNENKSCIIE
jgi:hypothetical protein